MERGWDVLTRERGIRPWKKDLTGLGFTGERCSAAQQAMARDGKSPLECFALRGEAVSAAPRGRVRWVTLTPATPAGGIPESPGVDGGIGAASQTAKVGSQLGSRQI